MNLPVGVSPAQSLSGRLLGSRVLVEELRRPARKSKATGTAEFDPLSIVARQGRDLMSLTIIIAAALVLDPEPSKERQGLDSAADARKAFVSEFGKIMATWPERRRAEWRTRLTEIDDEKMWSVSKQSFAEARRRVDGTLTEAERKTQVLHGTLDGLRRARGECWAVEYHAPFSLGGVIGYLDDQTGRLVFLWSPPEG